LTGINEGLDALDDVRFVGWISHAEPGRGRFEDMAVGEVTIDEVIDDGGNVALAFFLGAVLGEEVGKVVHELGEKGNREGPEIH